MSDARLQRIGHLLDAIEHDEQHPLLLYRPWPMQEPFHRSKASECLVSGGKRSGKTVCVSMEFVSRITGRRITLSDGTTIQPRWRVATAKAPRTYWVIGWNWAHARVLYKYLFEPGQGGTLMCIRDRVTNKWRIWNRADPDDAAREDEAKLTPPLITADMIEGGRRGIAWENHAEQQWKLFRLRNGATVVYYPSNQVTAQPGEAVAGIWIDEDIQVPDHLKEFQDRLIDMEGWFLWSVWPQDRNDALLGLMDRAEEAEGEPDPQIEWFRLDMEQNPFISSKGKSEALGRMEDDDEVSRRSRGDLLLTSRLMYEQFAPVVHCLRHQALDAMMQASIHPVRRKLTEIMMRDGRFPREWTRYLSLDPSFSRTACHSWVVPPPDFEGVHVGDIAIVEWEMILLRQNADAIAQALKTAMLGMIYEAFVMDQQIGKQTSVGRDDTVFQHFEMCFRKERLVSRQTMSGFHPGCNQPHTRFRTIRRMLTVQPDGMPTLLFVEEKTPITKKEFGTYKRKLDTSRRDSEVMLDIPSNPRKHDAMASLEYGGTFICSLFDTGVAYQQPSDQTLYQNPILAAVKELQAAEAAKTDGDYVHWGPGYRA
jgi:hypothetical protein